MQPEKLAEVRSWLKKAASDLTVFAWEFRYPGEAEVPPLEEAWQFRAVAGEVDRSILARLPQKAHPQSIAYRR
jgi:hypothetical protein